MKLVVKVKAIKLAALQIWVTIRIAFALVHWYKNVAKIEPTIKPAKTIEPSNPYYAFVKPNYYLIYTEPAGKLP